MGYISLGGCNKKGVCLSPQLTLVNHLVYQKKEAKNGDKFLTYESMIT